MAPIMPPGTVLIPSLEPGLKPLVVLFSLGYWIYLWYNLGKECHLFDSKFPLKRKIARFIGLLIPMLAFLWFILYFGLS